MTITKIFSSDDALFKKSAQLLVKIINRSIADTGKCAVALSGGQTPKRLYEILAANTYANLVNWRKVYFFWSDERCVPFDHPENNSKMAMDSLLQRLPVPDSNIFRVPVDLSPLDAAALYERTIRIFFGPHDPVFDIVLLGVGNDGHTASLFPGSALLQNNKDLIGTAQHPGTLQYRISFTYALINRAKNIVFLVSGNEKAAMVASILKSNADVPARQVKAMRGNKLFWLIDKAAAALLK